MERKINRLIYSLDKNIQTAYIKKLDKKIIPHLEKCKKEIQNIIIDYYKAEYEKR